MKIFSTKKLNILFYKIANSVLGLYWTVFKPRTVGAGVVIKNGSRVLLIKNTYRPLWSIPGGGNDKRETFIDTALRETKEEIGITLDKDDLKLLGVYQNNTEGKENISIIFLAEKNIGLNSLNLNKQEIAKADYFDLNNLPEDTEGVTKMLLKDLKANKIPGLGSLGNYK